MQERAADVYVAAAAVEKECDNAIHYHAGSGYSNHDAGVNVLGPLQAPECFVKDKKRNCNQRNRIDKCRQHACPVIAVSLRRARRARLQVNCTERKQECQEVRKIVPGFRKQCQRMRAQARNNQQHNIGQRDEQRHSQYARGTCFAVSVKMHCFKCKDVRTGVQVYELAGHAASTGTYRPRVDSVCTTMLSSSGECSLCKRQMWSSLAGESWVPVLPTI